MLCEPKILGCFNFKGDRNGYIDEAGVIGKESPTYKDKVYTQTEPRAYQLKIIKPKEEKEKEKKESLSPCSYNNLDSFKVT